MTDRRRAVTLVAQATLAVVVLTVIGIGAADAATAYRWVDGNGVVVYSDRSPADGVNVLTPRVDAPSTSPAPPATIGPPSVDAPPATAAPPSPPAVTAKPLTVDQLMEVTGLHRQFAPLSELLVQQFQAELGQLTPADRAVALRALSATLAPERLRQSVRAELARQADRNRIEAVVAWHRGPLGVRREAAVATLNTPAGRQELAAFMARVRSVPPTPGRMALIERLDWIEGGSDDNVGIVMAAARAMRLGLNALLPAGRRQRPGAVERQLERTRREIQAAVRQQVLVSMLFVYRGLTDQELEQTIAFVASEPSRWFDGVVRHALVRAVTDATERATRDLVRAVPVERWQAQAAAASR